MIALKYTVRASMTQESMRSDGCDTESEYDTLKEAKERAKYYVTKEFAKITECEIGYACVIRNKDGVNVFDVSKED